MTAYVVMIRDRMRDEAVFQNYAAGARDARPGHEFDILAFYGQASTLEGAEADGIVILAFPDRNAAQSWYDSPKYKEAKEHRFASADYRVMIVDGV